MKRYPIITISREYGSAGHDIAKELAARLDIPYYDGELIAMVSQNSGIPAELFHAAEDTATNAFAFALKSMGVNAPYGVPLNNQLFLIQSEFIRTIADTGPAVVVGRCADYVLENYAPTLNIFISADLENRVERTAQMEHLTMEEAKKTVLRKDKARATYYTFYTDRQWGDLHNYDLVINSSVIGIDASIDLLEFYVKHAGLEPIDVPV